MLLRLGTHQVQEESGLGLADVSIREFIETGTMYVYCIRY